VLLIDDLGKEKLTSAVAALLWELIDARYSNRRPMVITTRYGGAEFEARFGDVVLGTDIRRRVTECCDVVSF
jgi:DNA replication protein DnaC